jgi:hypothetical protein
MNATRTDLGMRVSSSNDEVMACWRCTLAVATMIVSVALFGLRGIQFECDSRGFGNASVIVERRSDGLLAMRA